MKKLQSLALVSVSFLIILLSLSLSLSEWDYGGQPPNLNWIIANFVFVAFFIEVSV